MAAITISRQLGAKGSRLARELAKDLGWEFTDKATIDRIISQYGLIRLNKIYDHPPKLRELFNENSQLTIDMVNQTLAGIAQRGDVVILTRAGHLVLKGLADVLNVFVEAPVETRVRRIAKRHNLDEEEAAARIAHNDKVRAKYTKLFYGATYSDPSDYDLVLNTEGLSTAEAAAKVVEAFRALPARAEGAATLASIEVDPVLATTIEEVLTGRPVPF